MLNDNITNRKVEEHMLKKLRKNQKGFTLIEVLIVVAILIILAAVAVPNIAGMRKEAAYGVIVANASEIATAINIYNTTASNPIQSSEVPKKSDAASTALKLKEKLGDLAPIIDSYEEDSYCAIMAEEIDKVLIFKVKPLDGENGIKETIDKPDKTKKVTVS